MRKNIAPLIDKMDILKQIHENYEVDFVLEIVPTIYSGDKNHCLAPSLDIIDFCHETRTEIDIDLYVMDAMEEVEELGRESYIEEEENLSNTIFLMGKIVYELGYLEVAKQCFLFVDEDTKGKCWKELKKYYAKELDIPFIDLKNRKKPV